VAGAQGRNEHREAGPETAVPKTMASGAIFYRGGRASIRASLMSVSSTKVFYRGRKEQSITFCAHRTMVFLGLAQANTSVGVRPENSYYDYRRQFQ
jgi:hypothetical protein